MPSSSSPAESVRQLLTTSLEKVILLHMHTVTILQKQKRINIVYGRPYKPDSLLHTRPISLPPGQQRLWPQQSQLVWQPSRFCTRRLLVVADETPRGCYFFLKTSSNKLKMDGSFF